MSIIQKLIIGFYWRNGPGVTFYLKFLPFIRYKSAHAWFDIQAPTALDHTGAPNSFFV